MTDSASTSERPQLHMPRKRRPKTLIGLAVLIFSIASYVGWSEVFDRTQGKCLGPICITPEEVTLE